MIADYFIMPVSLDFRGMDIADAITILIMSPGINGRMHTVADAVTELSVTMQCHAVPQI